MVEVGGEESQTLNNWNQNLRCCKVVAAAYTLVRVVAWMLLLVEEVALAL